MLKPDMCISANKPGNKACCINTVHYYRYIVPNQGSRKKMRGMFYKKGKDPACQNAFFTFKFYAHLVGSEISNLKSGKESTEKKAYSYYDKYVGYHYCKDRGKSRQWTVDSGQWSVVRMARGV